MSLIHALLPVFTAEVPVEEREVGALGCPFAAVYTGFLASLLQAPNFQLPFTQGRFLGLPGSEMLLGIESHRARLPTHCI